MMNKDKLTSIIKKKTIEENISFNVLLQIYFFECFLNRLSNSKYKNNVILKGGFLISSILGISERSTLDLDFNVVSIPFTVNSVEEMVNDINNINVKDNIDFELIKINDIMQQNQYSGYQVSLIGKLDNIHVPFSIDVATGDPITPSKKTYYYKSLILDKNIELYSYNIETVLSEKIQTIIDKSFGNSRMKDFYDIYLLMKLRRNYIDYNLLKTALKNTFEYRKTKLDLENVASIINVLETDTEFIKRWTNYVKKNYYVDDIEFKAVSNEIRKLVETILKVNI
ncbi:nucleotidyl transferase AbiEii/AbiGii toxin family protein [Candidatus Izemoplasma sp. B36]|uniref:nucleotidyl transferase AbiEii/AbiGii toxin family protein n=1 Tax=Candidatus Izemoplasma sp. B36 TaxID=3242468 RepID=UPI0035563D23